MFYRVVCAFLRLFFLTYFRWQVEGIENVPSTGGAILAGNHVSYLDPPIMGCAAKRVVHFMAKSELFENPVLGAAIRKLNAFPVQRGAADRNAIRRAMEILNEGGIVGVFPEGTRSTDGNLLPAQGGAAMIALKTKVPIIPVAIIGTERVVPKGKLLPRPVRVKVRFGKAIFVNSYEKVDKENVRVVSQTVMKEIRDLLVA